MSNIICFVMGVVVATVGFSGVAKWADQGVQVIKQEARHLNK